MALNVALGQFRTWGLIEPVSAIDLIPTDEANVRAYL